MRLVTAKMFCLWNKSQNCPYLVLSAKLPTPYILERWESWNNYLTHIIACTIETHINVFRRLNQTFGGDDEWSVVYQTSKIKIDEEECWTCFIFRGKYLALCINSTVPLHSHSQTLQRKGSTETAWMGGNIPYKKSSWINIPIVIRT